MDRADQQRFAQHLQAEVDGAALYRALVEIEVEETDSSGRPAAATRATARAERGPREAPLGGVESQSVQPVAQSRLYRGRGNFRADEKGFQDHRISELKDTH